MEDLGPQVEGEKARSSVFRDPFCWEEHRSAACSREEARRPATSRSCSTLLSLALTSVTLSPLISSDPLYRSLPSLFFRPCLRPLRPSPLARPLRRPLGSVRGPRADRLGMCVPHSLVKARNLLTFKGLVEKHHLCQSALEVPEGKDRGELKGEEGREERDLIAESRPG